MHDKIEQASYGIFTLIFFGIFGCWGGLARYLHVTWEERRKFSWFGLFCGVTIGGFLGLLFGILALHYQADTTLSLFIAGSSGAMGWKTIDLVLLFVKTRVKMDDAATEDS